MPQPEALKSYTQSLPPAPLNHPKPLSLNPIPHTLYPVAETLGHNT